MKGAMRIRLLWSVVALLLVAVVVALTPLAYADPPDPTWIRGMWDDDDFDDIVGYVTSSTGLVETPVVCEYVLTAPWEGLTPPAFDGVAAFVSLPASSPRAPPAA